MTLRPDQLERLRARFPTLAVLPSCTVVDSWFGEEVSLADGASVHTCRIGKGAQIGARSRIVFAEIGDRCRIGKDCSIGGDGAADSLVTRIGREARIGEGTRIMAGVTIGEGAVVPAGSVIRGNVPGAGLARVESTGDADDDLPLREFLLEKLPLANVFQKWTRAHGDATLRVNYPLSAASRVLDVGGYQGDWTHEILRRYGARIDVFEPVRGFARQIRRRFQNAGRVTVHEFGLAGSTRTEEISLASESSSVLRAASSARECIRLIAAKEILEAIEGDIALMKINIEGCEYELLEHLLDEGLTGRVRHLQIQFHDFVADARSRRRAIRARLRNSHREAWNYPFIWEGWARKDAEQESQGRALPEEPSHAVAH